MKATKKNKKIMQMKTNYLNEKVTRQCLSYGGFGNI